LFSDDENYDRADLLRSENRPPKPHRTASIDAGSGMVMLMSSQLIGIAPGADGVGIRAALCVCFGLLLLGLRVFLRTTAEGTR